MTDPPRGIEVKCSSNEMVAGCRATVSAATPSEDWGGFEGKGKHPGLAGLRAYGAEWNENGW